MLIKDTALSLDPSGMDGFSSYFSLPLSDSVFLDIETTGLSREKTSLYLIGAAYRKDRSWHLRQWFAQSREEEPLLLEECRSFLDDYTHILTYNGAKFDLPFLEHKCSQYQKASLTGSKQALDLYQLLLPCRFLCGFSHMRQTDLEEFLSLPPRSFPEGKEGLSLYRSYLKSREPLLLEKLTGHNQEDLCGLLCLFPLFSYRSFLDGDFSLSQAFLKDDSFFARLKLSASVPRRISVPCGPFYLILEGDTAKVSASLSQGRLPRYFENYKEYYYLPGEDTALIRTLGAYMDKSLREPARPVNCYIWFLCTQAFLENLPEVEAYLKQTLCYVLKTPSFWK